MRSAVSRHAGFGFRNKAPPGIGLVIAERDFKYRPSRTIRDGEMKNGPSLRRALVVVSEFADYGHTL